VLRNCCIDSHVPKYKRSTRHLLQQSLLTWTPCCSIVAIPGIGADPGRTWCSNNGVNWLKDSNMLPAHLSHARVLQFKYESNWLGEDSIDQRCSLIADQFLRSMQAARQVRASLFVILRNCLRMWTSAGFKISPIHLYRTLFWRHNHGEGLWPLAFIPMPSENNH
jgi:hypothetical protein